MTYRLGNIDDRGVLVVGDHYHDIELASAGAIAADPMMAVENPAALHELSMQVADRAP